VHAPDEWFCKGISSDTLGAEITGRTVRSVRRVGKLMILDLNGERRLGLRFGMTGRLIVDGATPVERLQYGPSRQDASWDRFALLFAGSAGLRINDPRRLGGVELDPAESRLGPDAASLTRTQLVGALQGAATPLKARLLDQARVAGLGNLLCDELLWRAGLDPTRAAGSLTFAEVAALHRSIRATVRVLSARGGSHLGDLGPHRTAGGRCPRDHQELVRGTVAGRTTYWCPAHQS
jgi:formamidopyrimidine-DNA glycosylase